MIASAVLSVSSNKEPEDKRLNAQLNRIADLIVRITHGAVGVVAWMAVNEMPGTDDQLLHALIRIGVLLKLVACFLPVCQLEFLSRNGSTLLLLFHWPHCTLTLVDLQTAAFVLAVVARAGRRSEHDFPKNDFSLDKHRVNICGRAYRGAAPGYVRQPCDLRRSHRSYHVQCRSRPGRQQGVRRRYPLTPRRARELRTPPQTS